MLIWFFLILGIVGVFFFIELILVIKMAGEEFSAPAVLIEDEKEFQELFSNGLRETGGV